MQDESGIRAVLQFPLIYNFFQEIVGGNVARRRFLNEVVKAKIGDKIVDVGCGPSKVR